MSVGALIPFPGDTRNSTDQAVQRSGAVIGDSMAQWFTGGAFDVMRNVRMSLYGLVIGGPSGHYWHQVLVNDTAIIATSLSSAASLPCMYIHC